MWIRMRSFDGLSAARESRPAECHREPLAEPDMNLWLAKCYFSQDSSEFSVLLPFFDAQSRLSKLAFRFVKEKRPSIC